MRAIVKKIVPAAELGQDPEFSFSIQQDDGVTLLSSGLYRSKDSAYKGIRAIKKNCVNDNRYIINKDANERYSFQIKSANGVVIVNSKSFPAEHEMREAVKQLKHHVPECEIDFHRTPDLQH